MSIVCISSARRTPYTDLYTVPTNETIWSFLFDSPFSPLTHQPASQIAGFTNAATKARISYAELKSHSTHISSALTLKHSFQPGDTVALFAPNTIWYPVALFAVLRAGGVVSGASPAYNVEEMAYALKTAKAKWLMTVPGSMGVARAAAEKAGLATERVILLEGEMDGMSTLEALVEEGKKLGEAGQVQAWKVPEGKRNGDVCAFLSFSSGTTGLPKAVRICSSSQFCACMPD